MTFSKTTRLPCRWFGDPTPATHNDRSFVFALNPADGQKKQSLSSPPLVQALFLFFTAIHHAVSSTKTYIFFCFRVRREKCGERAKKKARPRNGGEGQGGSRWKGVQRSRAKGWKIELSSLYAGESQVAPIAIRCLEWVVLTLALYARFYGAQRTALSRTTVTCLEVSATTINALTNKNPSANMISYLYNDVFAEPGKSGTIGRCQPEQAGEEVWAADIRM